MLNEELKALIQNACDLHEVILVEADLFSAGKRRVLRLFIDKVGGVTIDDCSKVSHSLSLSLDASPDIIEGAFTLEVSSPGLDRPLKSDADFQRNVGRTLRVTRSFGKPLVGILKSFDASSILLELKGNAGELSVLRSDILSAKVEVQI